MATRHVSRYERGSYALTIAGSYVVAVVLATAYVAIAARQPDTEGMEALVLFVATSPTSQVLTYLPVGELSTAALEFGVFPAAGLFQAWVLWRIARGRRSRPVHALT